LGAVVSLFFFERQVMSLAVAYVIAGAIGTAISLAVLIRILHRQDLLRHFRWSAIRTSRADVLWFGLPLLMTDVAVVFRTSFVTLLLEVLHGLASVATYRAVLPVARLNLVVMETFKPLFSPTAARMIANGDKQGLSELYWRNTAWLAILTFPLFAVSFALAQPVVVALFGGQYADSGPVLSCLSLGFFLNAAFGFNTLTLRVCNHVRVLVVNDLITAAVAIGLNLALIPHFGAIGGAVAACVSLVLQNLLHQAQLVRTGSIQSPPAECVRALTTIAIASLVLFAAQWILTPPLWVGIPLGGLAFLMVLGVNYRALQLEATFPEILRFGPVRKLHAALSS
jgi:O-antigen/teichoic acid export membrane protein